MREKIVPNNDETEPIKNKIWLTSKTRMQAEKRYAMYDNMAHIILCVFSIALIGLTVFSKRLPQTVPIDAYAVWFSVWVIVFSVVVFGFAFGKTSVLHRECYLRLQKLYDSRADAKDIENSYHEIMSSYPNHSDTDYNRLILSRTLFHSGVLFDPSGQSLKWNWFMIGKFLVSQVVFWLSPILVLVISVGSIFWFW